MAVVIKLKRGVNIFKAMIYLMSSLSILLITGCLGETYLAPGNIPYILAAAGENGGIYEIHLPGSGLSESRRLSPFYTDTYFVGTNMWTQIGVENKTILVTTKDDDISIYGESDLSVFNILPVHTLGKKYIVSTCQGVTVLVIASQAKTDVQVTLKCIESIHYKGRQYFNGDTILATADPYETIMIESLTDITGTIVMSTEDVGVFVASMPEEKHTVEGYLQLLPVKFYGTEYIVTASDKLELYNLQIVAEHSDAIITFSNRSSINVDGDGELFMSLKPDQHLYFSSSQPIMTTMCSDTGRSRMIVPPTGSYTNQSSLFYPANVRILTRQDNHDVTVNQMSLSSVPMMWKDIPGTRYKIGSCQVPDTPFSSSIITSSSSFAVLAFDTHFLINGGMIFPARDEVEEYIPVDRGSTSAPIPSTTSQPVILTDTQTCDKNNTELIVGLSCGLVIAILLVGNMIFVFNICQRRQHRWKRLPSGDNPSRKRQDVVRSPLSFPLSDAITFSNISFNEDKSSLDVNVLAHDGGSINDDMTKYEQ